MIFNQLDVASSQVGPVDVCPEQSLKSLVTIQGLEDHPVSLQGDLHQRTRPSSACNYTRSLMLCLDRP
ncbi:hypothetical protein VTO73DRAFT_4687 [Trametes versicolor]